MCTTGGPNRQEDSLATANVFSVPRTGTPGLHEHVQHIREYDWSKTSLGSLKLWPQDLLQVCQIILLDPQPRLLLLGNERYMFHNEAYNIAFANRDPQKLGRPVSETVEGVPEGLIDLPMPNSAGAIGHNFHVIDYPVTRDINGSQTTTIWCWTTMALSGSIPGYYVSINDVTEARINENRSNEPSSEEGYGKSTTVAHFSEKQFQGLIDRDQSTKIAYRNSKMSPPVKAQHLLVETLTVSGREAATENEDHQQMLQVIDLAGVGISEFDMGGQLVYTNKTWLRMSGHNQVAEPLNTLSVMDNIFAEDFDRVRSQWGKAVSGLPVTFEMRYNASGSDNGNHVRFPVLAAFVPVKGEDGASKSVLACMTDLTAHKLATNESSQQVSAALEKAKFSDKRLVNFAESSPIGMYFIEQSQGQVTYVNPAWFEQTGHPIVPFDEIDWPAIIHDDDKQMAGEFWRNVVSAKKTSSLQIRMKRNWVDSNGVSMGPVWISTSAIPELGEDGSVQGVIGTMEDISALKWAEKVQEMRVEEAIEARRQQENFIDMTSHEIRNPLGAVVHCADAVLESISDVATLLDNDLTLDRDVGERLKNHVKNGVELLNTIVSCSAHQKRIVDDILVLSKLDSNLLQIAPISVQASSLLSGVERMFIAEAANNHITLKTEPDLSLQKLNVDWVMLDPGRVQQVLINLVTNAIKFSRNRPTRNVTIRMGASRSPPTNDLLGIEFTVAHTLRDGLYDSTEYANNSFHLYFTVSDTGPGLSVEEKGRIFSRFMQASPKTYTEYGGSGLGLFISRELSEMQGGEIGLASEPGVGSTFAFFVKTYHTESPVKKLPSFSKPVSNKPSTTSATSILVVEDNAVNQRILRKQLAKQGFEVHVADNGQEALNFIKTTRHWQEQRESSERRVDVILMDVEMPVMDGLTATKKIRKLENEGLIRDHIPIIAVSANARTEQTQQAIMSGMDETITKPFHISDLIPKIDMFVKVARE